MRLCHDWGSIMCVSTERFSCSPVPSLLRASSLMCTFLSATCWFSHISSLWILVCRGGREGGGSGLWGMLGDFNNAEAVQWDLIKDDVITEPWLWATFPHSNIRSLSFSLSHTHTHTHTPHQPSQLCVHVWFTYCLHIYIYTKMHQSLRDKPRNYDSKCLIM